MMGLESGKCGNSFKGPPPKPQMRKTNVGVKQVSRNCWKNIISGYNNYLYPCINITSRGIVNMISKQDSSEVL